MMSSMDISNQVMLVVFVLAMTLGIINIMLMSVFERTREFGVLMAVGMQQHKIRILITLETMFLGLTGCALGLFGSAAMIKLLSVTGLSLGGLADGLGAYGVDTLLYPRVSFYEYQMIIVAILWPVCLRLCIPHDKFSSIDRLMPWGEDLMTIKLERLTKTYNPDSDFPVHAVQHVDLEIKQGEFVAIMGPSGSGKTTLLNMLGGIDAPTSGSVEIDGCLISEMSEKELIAYRRDNIGFIFQDYSLLPVLTALENVEFVMQLQGKTERECRERAMSLLEQVGLAQQMHKRPSKMSGGQQQRVAVARALAPKPRFVMADEPTANLDAKSTSELLDIMELLSEQEGTTFIFSTHDPRVIKRAHRIIVLKTDASREISPTSVARQRSFMRSGLHIRFLRHGWWWLVRH